MEGFPVRTVWRIILEAYRNRETSGSPQYNGLFRKSRPAILGERRLQTCNAIYTHSRRPRNLAENRSRVMARDAGIPPQTSKRQAFPAATKTSPVISADFKTSASISPLLFSTHRHHHHHHALTNHNRALQTPRVACRW